MTFRSSKPIERLDFASADRDGKRGDGRTQSRIADDRCASPGGTREERLVFTLGFFEHKLAEPNVWDQGKIKSETEKLRMPNVHLTPEQIRSPDHLADGQPGERTSVDISVPASRLPPRHPGRLVGGQEVQLHGLPPIHSRQQTADGNETPIRRCRSSFPPSC